MLKIVRPRKLCTSHNTSSFILSVSRTIVITFATTIRPLFATRIFALLQNRKQIVYAGVSTSGLCLSSCFLSVALLSKWNNISRCRLQTINHRTLAGHGGHMTRPPTVFCDSLASPCSRVCYSTYINSRKFRKIASGA